MPTLREQPVDHPGRGGGWARMLGFPPQYLFCHCVVLQQLFCMEHNTDYSANTQMLHSGNKIIYFSMQPDDFFPEVSSSDYLFPKTSFLTRKIYWLLPKNSGNIPFHSFQTSLYFFTHFPSFPNISIMLFKSSHISFLH